VDPPPSGGRSRARHSLNIHEKERIERKSKRVGSERKNVLFENNKKKPREEDEKKRDVIREHKRRMPSATGKKQKREITYLPGVPSLKGKGENLGVLLWGEVDKRGDSQGD